jgi:hypothetical protein
VRVRYRHSLYRRRNVELAPLSSRDSERADHADGWVPALGRMSRAIELTASHGATIGRQFQSCVADAPAEPIDRPDVGERGRESRVGSNRLLRQAHLRPPFIVAASVCWRPSASITLLLGRDIHRGRPPNQPLVRAICESS